MNTKEFNDERAKVWLDKMSKDESRIWMIVGMKQNNAYTFMADTALTPEKIADRLETLAKAIRERNSNAS